MIKNITLIILFFALSLKLVAQDSTFQNIDSKSYQLYLDKDWSELIKVSKKAIQNGEDYYYLRMRLGIAYYEQKKYNLSYTQFLEAKKFDNNDLLNEYLYYSYYFAGNYAEAEQLSNNFNDELKQKLDIENKNKRNYFSSFYGGFINSSYDKLYSIRENKTSIFTLNNRFRNKYNQVFGANIKFKLNPNYTTSIAYNKLLEPKTQIIQNNISIEEISNNTSQSNLYFNLVYSSLKFNWFIGVNFITVQDNYIEIEEIIPDLKKKEIDIKYTNSLFSTGFIYNTPYISIGLNTSFSNLNSNRQFQLGTGLYIYPKANKNIIIYAEPYFQNISGSMVIENSKSNRTQYEYKSIAQNTVVKLGLKTKIYRNTYIEFMGYFGKLNQFNENVGYYVYNDIDPINLMLKTKLDMRLSKKLSFFVSYTYSEKEHKYETINYFFPPTVVVEKISINITNQNIIGGFTWHF